MTGQRQVYVIALVVAVLALVASLAGAMTFTTAGQGWHLNSSAQDSSPDGWGQGLAGNGMMGQGRGGGGMMGDWDDQDTPSITADQATTAAEAWASANQPGAAVGAVVQMPMGYLFTVTKDWRSVGTIIVNDDTGQVASLGGHRTRADPADGRPGPRVAHPGGLDRGHRRSHRRPRPARRRTRP